MRDFTTGTPAKLVEGRYLVGTTSPGRTYDVSPDGRRFLMIKTGEIDAAWSAPREIAVVQNWDQELKRLVLVN